MFIVAGKRRVFPVKGYMAGFCHFGRGLRHLRLREVHEVSHLSFVSIGKGKLLGYRLDCTECGAPSYVSEVAAIDWPQPCLKAGTP